MLLIGIIGFLLIAITCCIFFLFGFEKTAARILALCFVLFSEILLFVGLLILSFYNDLVNQVFIRSGVIGVLSLYFASTVTLSLFSHAFSDSVTPLVLTEIIFLAVMLIVLTLLLFFSLRINHSDAKAISERKLMQICEKRIYDLLVDPKNQGFETKLKKLYETIKYSDKIGSSSVDEKIVGAIMRLEKGLESPDQKDENSETILDEITAFVSQRTMEIAENKRGGF